MGAYIKTQSLPRVEDPLTQRALSIIEEELTRLANATAGTVLWGNGLQYVPGTRVASIDYNTTNFKITSGELNTIQDIDITAEVQFAKLGLGMVPVNVLDVIGLSKIKLADCEDYTGLHPYTALLLENDGNCFIQLQGSTTGDAGIVFADDDYNPPAGGVKYDFYDEEIQFTVATNTKMTLDADGLLTVSSLALDAHNVDSYIAFKEDGAIQWSAGFDYDDGSIFKISEGIPGTNTVVEIVSGQGSLHFVRAADKGLQYLDTGDGKRWMMRVASGTDVVEILNRAAHGTVEIHANTVTAGAAGDVLVATFEDDLITLAVDMSGTDLTLSAPSNIYALSHDSFTDFVADEHIAHSGVSISAGGILSGGGTIAASRTISLAHGDVDHDQTANTHNLTTDIDHDALTNYEATQHFLQSAITELGTIATGVWQGTPIADAYIASEATWNAKAASGANADITSMSGITGTIATPTNLASKTTAAWSKSIGSGGDYADWATMIAAMPDLIAHAVTVTIKDGTTLSEICNLRNKHGITASGTITIQAEKYFPTSGNIPTADSATATTLRDAALATAALGDDYFNGCWVFIVDVGTNNITGVTVGGAGAGEFKVAGDLTARYLAADILIVKGSTNNDGYYTVSAGGSTHVAGTTTIPVDEAVAAVADGTIQTQGVLDNGFVPITDYVDATGDVVVASWSAAQPMVGDRYLIVGALIDCGGTRVAGFSLYFNTARTTFYGIGVKDSDNRGIEVFSASSALFYYCAVWGCDAQGINFSDCLQGWVIKCGIVNNNTDDSFWTGGLDAANSGVYTQGCGISDNNRRGIGSWLGSRVRAYDHFGDGNGLWGCYAMHSGQALFSGTECSGSSGNHSDPGTAGNANADQAAAY